MIAVFYTLFLQKVVSHPNVNCLHGSQKLTLNGHSKFWICYIHRFFFMCASRKKDMLKAKCKQSLEMVLSQVYT